MFDDNKHFAIGILSIVGIVAIVAVFSLFAGNKGYYVGSAKNSVPVAMMESQDYDNDVAGEATGRISPDREPKNCHYETRNLCKYQDSGSIYDLKSDVCLNPNPQGYRLYLGDYKVDAGA